MAICLFRRILPISVTALFLFCRTPAVWSLSAPSSSSSSSSSPLVGYYHFGTSSTTKTANPYSKTVTAYDALQQQQQQQQQQYVPDGLTLEQYTKIKNEELAKTRSMNFGAWGPRFQLVDGDPDSNWFNLPSLWTGGYNPNNVKQKHEEKTHDRRWNSLSKKIGGMAHVLEIYLRRYALAYMMLLLSTHLLLNKSTLPSTKYVMSITLPKCWPTVIIGSRTLLTPLAILRLLNLMAGTLIEKKWTREVTTEKTHGTTIAALAVALVMGLVSFITR